jgi:hypothetical protein
LPRHVLPRDEDEVRVVVENVEQAKSETVEHAEKVSTERAMGRKHESWDVRTDKERYWVITSPTSLYCQSVTVIRLMTKQSADIHRLLSNIRRGHSPRLPRRL